MKRCITFRAWSLEEPSEKMVTVYPILQDEIFWNLVLFQDHG